MLGNSNISATIAVSDLTKAKEFYGTTLGLNQKDENPGGIAYTAASGDLFVYESQTAGHNQATSADFEVANIEEVVAALKDKGVTFEHYDMPGTTLEGDVHVMGPMKAAWFKDPDGNILGLSSMPTS